MLTSIHESWHLLTFFPDKRAREKEEWEHTLLTLAEEIRSTNAASREKLPWLKLARFGDERSPKGCLRTNANILEISGVEAEHDAGTMTFDAAVEALRAAHIRCLVYTSPSYVKEVKERWRALLPFSKLYPPDLRSEMVACVNGLLGDAVTKESFTRSQAFFYGKVNDNPDHRVEVIDGDFIDLRPDTYDKRLYKSKAAKPHEAQGPAPEAKPVDREEVAAALACIDSACSYALWRNIAAALFHQFGDDGFDLFDNWSIKATGTAKDGSPMYTADKAETQWHAARSMTQISIGTVFHHANEADPGWRARYQTKLAQDVAERLQALVPVETLAAPERPANDAPWDEQIGWLLLTRGYCETADTIVELYAASNQCQTRREAFKFEFQAWHKVYQNEGKKKIVRAPVAWGLHPMRKSIKGVYMRPDQPFPIYQEEGAVYKNTYRRPQHPEGGNLAAFMLFMARLIPDRAEREWLFDWMAHKWLRPEIPGSAVIFVADNEHELREGVFGTGRGMLFRIAYQLYGPQYARPQSFNVLDGTSGQSAYTDWMHGSVLVTVDESRTSPTAYRRGERSAVYDVLKDIVDPAPKRHDFKGKYVRAFSAMSYCSFWIATNHADAVAIPEQDRRFTVLRNGRAMLPAEAVEIDAWMARPENIGALARWLAERDLSAFNMFQPLRTVGKVAMAEMARSEVEEILRDFMADDSRGLVFTRAQLADHVENNLSVKSGKWHGDFERLWGGTCTKALAGDTDIQRRVRTENTRKRLYCFRTRQEEVKSLSEAAARREAVKWGGIDTGVTRLEVLLGGKDKAGSQDGSHEEDEEGQ